MAFFVILSKHISKQHAIVSFRSCARAVWWPSEIQSLVLVDALSFSFRFADFSLFPVNPASSQPLIELLSALRVAMRVAMMASQPGGAGSWTRAMYAPLVTGLGVPLAMSQGAMRHEPLSHEP